MRYEWKDIKEKERSQLITNMVDSQVLERRKLYAATTGPEKIETPDIPTGLKAK